MTGAQGNQFEMPSAQDMRVYVVTHIGEAIESGWIQPYYQPVVRTLTGKLCGQEALARWDDPTYGLLAPAVFIPALEEAKLIHLLDCSIVRTVCSQYREAVDRGIPTVPVSFNLSRLDFDLCDIFQVVESAVREHEVPRRMLNIEITESVLGADPEYMTEMMNKFHEAGYQVWMDDFGSGYSTLNVLKDFDFDELKIDMEFLNRFGEKSKTILASVVDMAKKLGIQTLAEGVETEEHRHYLQRIGCEKMQGYLFGKPARFSTNRKLGLYDRFEVESTAERLYFNEIGAINTLSLSERDLTAVDKEHGYVTSMPIATVEYEDDKFKIIDSNLVFREGLENVGVSSIDEAEKRINDLHRPLARQVRHLVETIGETKFARAEYIVGGVTCVMRAKHITTQNGKMALLVSIDDTIEQSERKRHERMDDTLSIMYSIYEHVDIIHLDEKYIEQVFGNMGLRSQYEARDFSDVTGHFADVEVYPVDRERFMAFMDHDTMVDRIEESGESFIVGFFRLKQHGGDYAWKLFALIHLEEKEDAQVMLCIRGTHWGSDGLLQSAYDDNYNEEAAELTAADLAITDGSLWRALVQDTRMSLFWKDRDRRFVGVNDAFLDYYNFDSAKEVEGKTDEEMGWHIDPTPFKEDELRVLNEGAVVEDVVGQCIVRGEVRDIVASKRPVYRNGHIVGLVGYFTELSNAKGEDDYAMLPLLDPMTGVLNFTGLEAATWRYVDSYKRQGIDFCMISVNIESFKQINDDYGYEFGEKVLKRVADVLTDIVEHKRVIGHVFAERFVILAQEDDDAVLQDLCKEIEQKLMAITEVDGKRCTVYAYAGFARFSKLGDVEAMKRYNRDKRLERHEYTGETSAGEGKDVITSSLI